MMDLLKWSAQQAKRICAEGHTAPIEVLLSLITSGWGLWFLLNPYAFAAVPTYRAMAQVCSHEWAWGLLFAFTGLFRLLSVLADRRAARKGLAFWCTLLWLFTTFSTAMSAWASTAVPTAFLFAAASTWVYWRLPCLRCSHR